MGWTPLSPAAINFGRFIRKNTTLSDRSMESHKTTISIIVKYLDNYKSQIMVSNFI